MIVKQKKWIRPYDIASTRAYWPIALTFDPEPITNFLGALIIGLQMNAVTDKYTDMISTTIENECYGPDTATAFGSSADMGTAQFIWWIIEMAAYFPVFVLILIPSAIIYGILSGGTAGIGVLLFSWIWLFPLGWWFGIPIGHAITNVINLETGASGFEQTSSITY